MSHMNEFMSHTHAHTHTFIDRWCSSSKGHMYESVTSYPCVCYDARMKASCHTHTHTSTDRGRRSSRGHTYESVASHACQRHITHINQSCHALIRTHLQTADAAVEWWHISKRRVTHMSASSSCDTHECIIRRVTHTHHATHTNQSCHTHTYHATHTNQSCTHTYSRTRTNTHTSTDRGPSSSKRHGPPPRAPQN